MTTSFNFQLLDPETLIKLCEVLMYYIKTAEDYTKLTVIRIIKGSRIMVIQCISEHRLSYARRETLQ